MSEDSSRADVPSGLSRIVKMNLRDTTLVPVPDEREGHGVGAGGIGALAGEFPAVGGLAVGHGCAGEEVDGDGGDVIGEEFGEVGWVAVVLKMESLDGAGEGGLADAGFGADDGDGGFGEIWRDHGEKPGVRRPTGGEAIQVFVCGFDAGEVNAAVWRVECVDVFLNQEGMVCLISANPARWRETEKNAVEVPSFRGRTGGKIAKGGVVNGIFPAICQGGEDAADTGAFGANALLNGGDQIDLGEARNELLEFSVAPEILAQAFLDHFYVKAGHGHLNHGGNKHARGDIERFHCNGDRVEVFEGRSGVAQQQMDFRAGSERLAQRANLDEIWNGRFGGIAVIARQTRAGTFAGFAELRERLVPLREPLCERGESELVGVGSGFAWEMFEGGDGKWAAEAIGFRRVRGRRNVERIWRNRSAFNGEEIGGDRMFEEILRFGNFRWNELVPVENLAAGFQFTFGLEPDVVGRDEDVNDREHHKTEEEQEQGFCGQPAVPVRARSDHKK